MERGQINKRVPTVVIRLVTIHLAAVTYDEEEISSQPIAPTPDVSYSLISRRTSPPSRLAPMTYGYPPMRIYLLALNTVNSVIPILRRQRCSQKFNHSFPERLNASERVS